jgi:hypothetical protein
LSLVSPKVATGAAGRPRGAALPCVSRTFNPEFAPISHHGGRKRVASKYGVRGRLRLASEGGDVAPRDREQTVSEMVEEVLANQAKLLAERTGQTFESALGVVAGTEAGRRLRELADGEHRHEKDREWQASVHWERAERRLDRLFGSEVLSRLAGERHHSWVAEYLEWLEGKEARTPFHSLLEEELASLRG